MTEPTPIDEARFRRILARTIALPLASGVINAGLFVALILYLVSVFGGIDDTELVIDNASQTAKLSVDMQTDLRGYLITDDETFLVNLDHAIPEFSTGLNELRELVADNPVQVDRLDRLAKMHADWNTYAETVIDMKRSGEDYSTVVANRGVQEFYDMRQEFLDFQAAYQTLLRNHNDHAKSVTISAALLYVLVTILLTGFVSFIGRRELIQLSGTYSKSLTQLRENTELLEQQSWQRTGQAQLAERSIGKTVVPVLGRTVLDFLAQYINAAVAAIYVRDEQNGALRRIASYGFSKESDQGEQVFAAGESLVEQTAYSERIIHLQDVPEGYLKVNSGLGSSDSQSVVLVPLDHDGVVNGVMELGFLRTPTRQDLEFLKLVASNIGNALEMSMNRRRLQDALEETQQLNEELQAQQEELRSSNEELEEQSRVLEESQALLENQKAELEQSNEKLVAQADILDQKNSALNEIQIELEDRARELEKASQYKSEFLANMSHELRTPLNSSMILAKLLAENQKNNLDEEQVQFARNIYTSGNDLLNLINDILDISKVEAGKLDLMPEPISLRRLRDAMKVSFEPIAAQKNLTLVVDIEPGTPSSIYTDHQRLEQILKNLMSNAIKFTEQGSVILAIAGGANDTIEFSVTDTGIGIEEDQQKTIFEAFQQADGSISRRYGGTGLGLSISRDLAALLNGDLSVDSTPGAGSTFTLRLPVELTSHHESNKPNIDSRNETINESITRSNTESTDGDFKATVPVPAEPNPEATNTTATPSVATASFDDDRKKEPNNQRSVLVIEDDPEFAQILYNLSHELNYRCFVALTAIEGLQMASEFLPDAILLDIGLPDVSGMSVLQKLKVNSLTRHIPIHIVSAADRTKAALQLGAVGYVIKPATRDRLKQVFEKLEHKFTQQSKRVLLVEDDAIQREAVVKLISDKDVDIVAVERGEEAVELLRSTIFDCMIIDLKLPDMHGHELLQRMSTEELCSFPPVIVYTGRNLTRDEEHELLKYSRSIIIKGARSPERLLDEVTLFLHKVESELSPDLQLMLKTVRSRDKALEGRRILLVDDDVRNIFALTGALEQKGAMVEIARDGFEALKQLDDLADIDLVLMDIMMPGMDGLEATRRIRKDPRFENLPIIAVTAKAMKNDQEQCLKAGASDYLAKPIDIDRLYSLLRVWMPGMERI